MGGQSLSTAKVPGRRSRFVQWSLDTSLGGTRNPVASPDVSHIGCAFGPDPNEPQQDVKWAEKWIPAFLESNPDVQLHHMHDPNQDRLMIQRMTYFRVKRLWLGQAYGSFIQQYLEPGGTIFIVDCQLKWPAKKFGERHIFQFGALGGATPYEYHPGGKRVEEYLRRYKSHIKKVGAAATGR
jgi:hypothetical protein